MARRLQADDLGAITVGSNLSISGGTLDLGATIAPTVVNAGTLEVGGIALTGAVRGGEHITTAGEVTAGAVTIATGFGTIDARVVQIRDTNLTVTNNFSITAAAGNIIIGNNGTNSLTTADITDWIAFGH